MGRVLSTSRSVSSKRTPVSRTASTSRNVVTNSLAAPSGQTVQILDVLNTPGNSTLNSSNLSLATYINGSAKCRRVGASKSLSDRIGWSAVVPPTTATSGTNFQAVYPVSSGAVALGMASCWFRVQNLITGTSTNRTAIMGTYNAQTGGVPNARQFSICVSTDSSNNLYISKDDGINSPTYFQIGTVNQWICVWITWNINLGGNSVQYTMNAMPLGGVPTQYDSTTISTSNPYYNVNYISFHSINGDYATISSWNGRIGRLLGRCSSERFNCDRAITGQLSSLANPFKFREISEISVARFSPEPFPAISCR